MPLSEIQMDKFETHFKSKTKRRCPMCGSKKFEFGFETLVMWKVDARGAAYLVEPDRGRILAFVECMECNITHRIRMQQTFSLGPCHNLESH